MREIGVSIIALLFFFVACAEENVSPIPPVNEQAAKESTAEQSNIVEERSIFVDKIKFDEPQVKGEITKNKLTASASVDIIYYMNDSEEYSDLFGERVSTAPFMVNFMCGVITLSFFNVSALQDMAVELANITGELNESEESLIREEPASDYLEGFTVKKVNLAFIDSEDKQKIAECTATGPNVKDIKFTTYRTYENSVFNAQIGEEVSEEKPQEVPQENVDDALCVELGCAQGTIAVGSINSDKWHYCHCMYASSIKEENLFCFSSIEEAEDAGYTETGRC